MWDDIFFNLLWALNLGLMLWFQVMLWLPERRALAKKNYHKARTLLISTSREVVVVLTLLLFIYFLVVAPHHIFGGLAISLVFAAFAYLVTWIPVTVGDRVFSFPRQKIPQTLLTTIRIAVPSFFGITSGVPVAPPRFILAA